MLYSIHTKTDRIYGSPKCSGVINDNGGLFNTNKKLMYASDQLNFFHIHIINPLGDINDGDYYHFFGEIKRCEKSICQPVGELLVASSDEKYDVLGITNSYFSHYMHHLNGYLKNEPIDVTLFDKTSPCSTTSELVLPYPTLVKKKTVLEVKNKKFKKTTPAKQNFIRRFLNGFDV